MHEDDAQPIAHDDAALSRAAFLRRAAAGTLLIPTAGGLLAACGGGGGSGGSGSARGPLYMTTWDAFPPQIRANLAAFTRQTGVPVKLTIVPNVGYGPTMQTRLRGGARIDVYYNFAYNTAKFVDAGWAKDLSGLDGIDEMLADMFPSAAERHRLADGRVISAPYFSALHVLHYNERLLRASGIAQPPATLADVHAQSQKLKAAGVRAPYAAYWTKQFIEEYLTLYLLAEGITPFDEKGSPVFADDPKTEAMFEWWASMYQDGLTSKTALTDDPNKLIAAMQQGDSAFLMLHHYFLKLIRDGKGPESANVTLSYRTPGAADTTLQIGETLQMGTKAGAAEPHALELLKYYGWKDDQGRYSTLTSWAKASALLGPYPKLFDQLAAEKALPDYYDLATLRQMFADRSQVVPARVLPWYATYQSQVGDRLHAMLLGQASPKDTVAGLASDAKNAAAAS
jgi:multiple sugar transport system substrate-binding protein